MILTMFKEISFRKRKIIALAVLLEAVFLVRSFYWLELRNNRMSSETKENFFKGEPESGRKYSQAIVVVAGAWTLPNHDLSLAFKQRIATGFEAAMIHQAEYLIFTGGKGDSDLANYYLLNRMNTSFGFSVEFQEWSSSHQGRKYPKIQDFPTVEKWLQHAKANDLPIPQILLEKKSRNTAENAIYTAELLRNISSSRKTTQSGSGKSSSQQRMVDAHGPLILVSSPYHLRRCFLYFQKYFSLGGVHVDGIYGLPSSFWEAEWVLPWTKVFIRTTIDTHKNGSVASTTLPRYHDDLLKGGETMKYPISTSTSFLVSLFPLWILELIHSLVASVKHLQGHLYSCVLSLPYVGYIRELVAFPVNYVSGHFTLWDWLQCW